MKKNDVVTVEIEDLTYEGLGVGKLDGFPLFIENALPTEKVLAKVLKVGKNFGFAKVIEHITTSLNRVAIKDVVGTRTGTMPLQHLVYSAQLRFKQEQVKRVFNSIAKMPEVEIRDTLGMEHPYEYRNKAQIPVRMIDGQLTTGFFRKNSHEVIPVENFYIQDPKIDQAVVMIRDIMRQFQVAAYDEQQHTGNLRHIIVRRGYYTGQMMVVLVTREKQLINQAEIVTAITQALPEVVSIVQNIHSERSNVILGKQIQVLYGQDYYEDELLGLRFKISSRSFYQINPTQTEVLYTEALKAAALTGREHVVDAYCGIGTISLSLAKHAKSVHAMEIVSDAIDMARENARVNRIENVVFEVGAAEQVMPMWSKEGLEVDVMVVDPPRKGLAPEFIQAAVEVSPQRIVYVSCNPATLARDVRVFANEGYTVQYVQPVDMFPQTTSIECVALLVKQ